VIRAVAIGVLMLAAGCGDNHVPPAVPDALAQNDGGVQPDAPPAANFTRFVHDIILNHTSDTEDPVPYAVFAVLPDPDLDDNEYAAYADLF
jgi:hypothetical protein